MVSLLSPGSTIQRHVLGEAKSLLNLRLISPPQPFYTSTLSTQLTGANSPYNCRNKTIKQNKIFHVGLLEVVVNQKVMWI